MPRSIRPRDRRLCVRLVAPALLLCVMAGCRGSTPKEPAGPATPAGPPPVVPGDLVVEGRFPGASTLTIEVTGYGLKDTIRSRFPVTNGEVLASIQVPPGTERLITVSALDQANSPTHRGSAYANVAAGVTRPVMVPLERIGEREPAALMLASYRVALDQEPFTTPGGPSVRYSLRAFDARNLPLPLSPDDVQWTFDDPFNRPVYIPCKPSQPGTLIPCIELTPPLKVQPDVVACLKDFICRQSFRPPAPQPGYRSITAGKDHTCALSKSGEILCWGSNQYGQLGATTTETCQFQLPLSQYAAPCSRKPFRVMCPAGSPCTFVAVDAGRYFTCAIDTNNHAWCWGKNDAGQLGYSSNTSTEIHQRITPTPITEELNLGFTTLSAGEFHTCAVSRAGYVFCWGNNTFNQGGVATPNALTARRISSGTKYASVSAGKRHTCAVKGTGDLDCWGGNLNNELANTPTIYLTPSAVSMAQWHPALQGAVRQVAAGWMHTCAHLTGGSTVCWGMTRPADSTILTAPAVTDVAAGLVGYTGYDEVCAVVAGEMFCGNTAGPLQKKPGSPANFATATVGEMHYCAVDTSGAAWCWGSNWYGQLSNGPLNATSNMVAVPKP